MHIPNYINEITVVRMVVFGFALFRLPPPLAHNSETRDKGTVSVSETRAHGHPCDVSICAIAPAPHLSSFRNSRSYPPGPLSPVALLFRSCLCFCCRPRMAGSISHPPVLPGPLLPLFCSASPSPSVLGLDRTLALLSVRSARAALASSSVWLLPLSLFRSQTVGSLIMKTHNALPSPTRSLSPLHHGFLLPQEPAQCSSCHHSASQAVATFSSRGLPGLLQHPSSSTPCYAAPCSRRTTSTPMSRSSKSAQSRSRKTIRLC
jgi:hypothetical protein